MSAPDGTSEVGARGAPRRPGAPDARPARAGVSAIAAAIAAEALKLRRTLALWMVLLAPLIVVLFQFFNFHQRGTLMVRARADAWALYSRSAFAVWAVFMLPLFLTLETALLNGIEHGVRGWTHLFALPVPRWTIYAAKLLVALALMLGAAFTLVLGLAASGEALHLLRPELGFGASVPWTPLLRLAALSSAAALLILSIHMWISSRWASMTVALGAGVAGTFFALFAAGQRLASFYPWLQPLRAVARPPEEARAAVLIGVVGGAVVALAGAWDVLRRDTA